MRFDLERVGGIAGNFAIESAGAAADQPRKAAAAGGPGDSREVDIAAQRAHTTTNSRGRSSSRRGFMAFVNEFRHGTPANDPKLSAMRTEL